ncbi:GDP-mannose 4,6-dehydratase [Candidatus Micrarchaeota archaeon]|nr:GDP-mannose 4,6-dehydratase [Candidatus Micrarchaeota archaeon]
MSILITGGAGFIGSHLTKALLDRGETIVSIDNFDPFYSKQQKLENLAQLKGKNFKFHEMDVRDIGMKKFLLDNSIEKIVHLAARPGVRPSLPNAKLYEEINVAGTLNMLEASISANIKNFVFISSSSIYGNLAKTPWKEEYDPQPNSPYAASKLAGEAYVKTYAELYGLPTSALRYFSIYGIGQRPDLAIAKFSYAILAGKPIEMFGDGVAKRDYTYISDAVNGTISALDKKFKFEVFNIGNSSPIALHELISLLEKNLGKKAKINKLPIQKGDLPNTYADISKAKRMLNYSPIIKIQEGLKIYCNHLKNHVK